MQNTKTIQLKKNEREDIKEILLGLKWREEKDSNEYVVFRMRSYLGSIAMLYTSGKLVLQGNEDFSSITDKLTAADNDTVIPHLGVDEVGKGDYFGPLIVVSCFVDNESLKLFEKIGVGDSKKFSDKKIIEMYEQLKDYPYYYASVVMPREYNQLDKEIGNVAILLARQHSKVIEMGLGDLKSKNIECNTVVIDQFSNSKARILDELGKWGKEAIIDQHHKGEDDVAVAAASVIARGIFVNEMDNLSKLYNFNFPKGASNVIEKAKEFFKKYGKEELSNVAKISFKTTKQVIS
jgi:ribonuclease HIII